MTDGPEQREPNGDARPGAMGMAPGDPAPDLTLLSEMGAQVALRDLWARAPRGLALVFIRSFGSPFARYHMAVLRDTQARFDEEGVRVAIVGMGRPEASARFRRRYDLPFPVLADPDRTAYRAYGLGEGPVLGWPELTGGFRLAMHGVLPGLRAGDARQLAGDFLIDRDGIVRYVRRSRRPADIPSPDALLAAAHELL